MAYGQVLVGRCGFWGVARGYGGYGLRPIARGLVWVLGRCPRLRWLWPAADCAWPGVGSGALPPGYGGYGLRPITRGPPWGWRGASQ